MSAQPTPTAGLDVPMAARLLRGVGQSSVGQWERGATTPTGWHLAGLLGVLPDLLGVLPGLLHPPGHAI